jgi:mRNA interferase MazF
MIRIGNRIYKENSITIEVILRTIQMTLVRKGMPMDYAVNLDHIQTVSKGKIGPVITTISSDKLEKVAEAIRFALTI